jgi:peptide/nickel transport system substrate-binding protein
LAGPYKLAQWVPDDQKVLDAFADYWGGRPKVDRIVIKPVPSGPTRVAALRAREADLVVSVPPDLIDSIRTDPGLKLIENNSGRRILFFLNTYAKPFNDLRVRQAANYAVDRTAIIKSLMGGLGRPLPGVAAPSVFGYTVIRGYDYDVAKAKQLLAEAGYPNGFDLVIESPNGHYFQDREISQAVAGYLKAVGIRATVSVYEWGQYAGRKRERKFDMGLWASLSNYRDFDDLGFNLEPSRASSFYDNAEVNELFAAGREENDATKRKAIYAKLTKVLEADAAELFGPEIIQAYGASARLRWQPWAGSDILFDLRNAVLQ